jgi:hypothetical protein
MGRLYCSAPIRVSDICLPMRLRDLQPGDNPFGIYSHLGFEYKFTKYINIAIMYQSNMVFSKSLIQHNAFYVGLGIQL